MKTSFRFESRRGSAILMAVIITVCLSIIIGSVFQFGLFERRMNAHEVLLTQARYAAESIVENACAQAIREVRANSSLSSDYFNTKKYISPRSFIACGCPAAAAVFIQVTDSRSFRGIFFRYVTLLLRLPLHLSVPQPRQLYTNVRRYQNLV